MQEKAKGEPLNMGKEAGEGRAKGFDQEATRIRRVQVQPQRRTMSVRMALEWAFGSECASLDLDDQPDWSGGTDTIWRLMQRGQLGCKVDGGGRSFSSSDAEVIASYVAALPAGQGGRSMAVRVAELARAGRVPDWMRDARPRCVPSAWRNTKHGVFAATETCGQVEVIHRGRRVVHPLIMCPVTYTPTSQQIASARRDWLAWWGALLHIGYELRCYARLSTVEVTQDMPPMTPWITRGGEKGLDAENVNL